MVNVLAFGLSVREFKPGRDDETLRAIKFLSTLSFGREVKSKAPCRLILRNVKEHFEV
jgi:hypothetical protein